MNASHASVHPVEDPPTTDGGGNNNNNNIAAPRVRMKEMQGMPGTKGGLTLRVFQFIFAAAALAVMATTSDFPSVTAFCYLVAAAGLQSLWSLSLAIVDIYALLVMRSLQNYRVVSLFAVGDGTRSCNGRKRRRGTAWSGGCAEEAMIGGSKKKNTCFFRGEVNPLAGVEGGEREGCVLAAGVEGGEREGCVLPCPGVSRRVPAVSRRVQKAGRVPACPAVSRRVPVSRRVRHRHGDPRDVSVLHRFPLTRFLCCTDYIYSYICCSLCFCWYHSPN